MSWKERYVMELKKEFGNRPFSVNDAKILGNYYSPNVINKLLSDLVRGNYLARYGRGIYVADTTNILPEHRISERSLPPTARKMVRILTESHVDFMLTGMSVLVSFMHLLPYRLIHSTYVMIGSGEHVSELLNSNGIKSALNPKNADEVSKALSLVDGDLVVIWETRESVGKLGHIASIERALVDAYFEATRNKIPISVSEVGRILRNVLEHNNINVTRMTKIASRHSIDKEVRGILVEEGLMPPSKNYVVNDHVREVTAVSDR